MEWLLHWCCGCRKTVVAYEKEAEPKQKRVTSKEYDEAFDAVSAPLLEQYRKQKQAKLMAQGDTTEEN